MTEEDAGDGAETEADDPLWRSLKRAVGRSDYRETLDPLGSDKFHLSEQSFRPSSSELVWWHLQNTKDMVLVSCRKQKELFGI